LQTDLQETWIAPGYSDGIAADPKEAHSETRVAKAEGDELLSTGQ
jgi:hypothetical protein